MKRNTRKRIVVGISGASGAIYGVRMLELLKRRLEVETHLVITENGEKIIRLEMGRTAGSIRKLASASYAPWDIEAPLSSGTFRTSGMAIIPCSMKTLSAVANSYSDNLLARAADVTLKEKRPLVLVIRETPLHEGHIDLMLKASRLGAVILPACPGFYSRPRDVSELVDQVVGKTLDALGIDNEIYPRWKD